MPGIGPAEAVQLGVGALQTGIGIVQSLTGKKKVNSLLAQQAADPFQIPGQIQDILNVNEFNSQGDTVTRNYETGAMDNAFAGTIGSEQRYSTGNANDYAAAFSQKMANTFQIGEQFHKSNMEAFAGLTAALQTSADYKTAAWQSRQDLIKNRIQAAQTTANTGTANVSGGVSGILGAITAQQSADLYDKNKARFVNGIQAPTAQDNNNAA